MISTVHSAEIARKIQQKTNLDDPYIKERIKSSIAKRDFEPPEPISLSILQDTEIPIPSLSTSEECNPNDPQMWNRKLSKFDHLSQTFF